MDFWVVLSDVSSPEGFVLARGSAGMISVNIKKKKKRERERKEKKPLLLTLMPLT